MLLWLANLGNAGGQATAPVFTGTIPDISVAENTGTHDYDYSTYFTGATSYSISPAVETGWTFNTSTAELQIDTDEVNTFGPYTITGTNLSGSDSSNAFDIVVTEEAVSEETYSGGWWDAYDYEYQRRKRKQEELEALEAKAEQIQDKLDRELAEELRKQDREAERIAELKRLTKLAEKHQRELENVIPPKVLKSAESAIIEGTYSKMERFERELKRAREEELFLIEATNIILNS